MKIDPYTMALCMRAMGVRKVAIRPEHAFRASPNDEFEQILTAASRTIELRLLEPVIDADVVG